MKKCKSWVRKKVFWENLEAFGSEHLDLEYNSNNILAKGTVLFTNKQKAYQVFYEVHLDKAWNTRQVKIYVDDEKQKFLSSDGCGHWFINNTHIKELDGAIDVDIAITPFSNSLPINRFDWIKGEMRKFNMVYIDIPSLELKNLVQHYTFLDVHNGYRLFKYECLEYKTTIKVDQLGIVVEYPDVFIRHV